MTGVMGDMMSDLMIVLDRDACAFTVMGAVCGLDGVVHEHRDEGVIHCSIPSRHVRALHHLAGVSYVRQIQSYYCQTAGTSAVI